MRVLVVWVALAFALPVLANHDGTPLDLGTWTTVDAVLCIVCRAPVSAVLEVDSNAWPAAEEWEQSPTCDEAVYLASYNNNKEALLAKAALCRQGITNYRYQPWGPPTKWETFLLMCKGYDHRAAVLVPGVPRLKLRGLLLPFPAAHAWTTTFTRWKSTQLAGVCASPTLPPKSGSGLWSARTRCVSSIPLRCSARSMGAYARVRVVCVLLLRRGLTFVLCGALSARILSSAHLPRVWMGSLQRRSGASHRWHMGSITRVLTPPHCATILSVA